MSNPLEVLDQTFDQEKPDAKEFDTIAVDGDEVDYCAKDSAPCCMCQNSTHWVSISFIAFFCSRKCLNRMWDSFWQANSIKGEEVTDNNPRTFYRVNHKETQQGLWYDFDGNFTGLIHNELSFCENSGLAMDFDEEIVGFVSAVETLEDLYKWFPIDDIIRLQAKGFFIHAYESTDYKWYDRFSHWVINREKSRLVDTIILTVE